MFKVAILQYHMNRSFDRHALVDRPFHACARTQLGPESWLRIGLVRASRGMAVIA
jgi:hypothetical protein